MKYFERTFLYFQFHTCSLFKSVKSRSNYDFLQILHDDDDSPRDGGDGFQVGLEGMEVVGQQELRVVAAAPVYNNILELHVSQ